jgi:hypothetical protein
MATTVNTTESTKALTKEDLAALEPIIERLLAGTANTKEIAARLAELGHPAVLDQTEQLRLALRLLECHDDSVNPEKHSVKKRQKSARSPEAGLA